MGQTTFLLAALMGLPGSCSGGTGSLQFEILPGEDDSQESASDIYKRLQELVAGGVELETLEDANVSAVWDSMSAHMEQYTTLADYAVEVESKTGIKLDSAIKSYYELQIRNTAEIFLG